MSDSDLALSIALGIGLAAATGFRVFLPMLITSAAAYSGHLPLGENFAWLGTAPALAMLGVAAVVEILAYYIPGVDNLLDTLATPAAFVAGTIVSAAVMADVSPMLKWTTAIIAGGGIAGVTQGVTALLRAKSTVFTGRRRQPGHRHGGAWRLPARVAACARGADHRRCGGRRVPVVCHPPDPQDRQACPPGKDRGRRLTKAPPAGIAARIGHRAAIRFGLLLATGIANRKRRSVTCVMVSLPSWRSSPA